MLLIISPLSQLYIPIEVSDLFSALAQHYPLTTHSTTPTTVDVTIIIPFHNMLCSLLTFSRFYSLLPGHLLWLSDIQSTLNLSSRLSVECRVLPFYWCWKVIQLLYGVQSLYSSLSLSLSFSISPVVVCFSFLLYLYLYRVCLCVKKVI